MAVQPGPGDETILCGVIRDQAALHGVLLKVRDLGLTLISVRRGGRLVPSPAGDPLRVPEGAGG